MFESLALESPRSTRRNWTTAASFALQTGGMALLILAPIGYTEAVAPKFAEQIVAPVGITNLDTHTQPPPRQTATPTVPSQFHAGILVFRGIPANVRRIVDAANAQPLDSGYEGVFSGTNIGNSSAIDALLNHMTSTTAVGPQPSIHAKPYPISHLNAGMLIKQVQPVYPVLARNARIEGSVMLAAIIDTQGRITNLRALSGHPLLIPAAISAVQQWRYRPYILNGQPVEVETQITVNFSLHQE